MVPYRKLQKKKITNIIIMIFRIILYLCGIVSAFIYVFRDTAEGEMVIKVAIFIAAIIAVAMASVKKMNYLAAKLGIYSLSTVILPGFGKTILFEWSYTMQIIAVVLIAIIWLYNVVYQGFVKKLAEPSVQVEDAIEYSFFLLLIMYLVSTQTFTTELEVERGLIFEMGERIRTTKDVLFDKVGDPWVKFQFFFTTTFFSFFGIVPGSKRLFMSKTDVTEA